MMILIGIPIGLYGYLFPGNINLMMLEIYRTGENKVSDHDARPDTYI